MILTTRKVDSKYIDEVKVYSDVESEFLNFTPKCRVLPAPFYDEPTLEFELLRRYDPGENKYFPNGGFEIYGPGNERRSFDLDQVVLHPFSLGKFNYFKKGDNLEIKNKVTDPNKPKGKKGRPRKLDENGNPIIIDRTYKPTGGQRGRKPKLDENGNRIVSIKKEYVPSGRGRGRKPLSPEERAKRELETQQKIIERQKLIISGVITGGRGRPSTLTPEQKEERRLKEEEKDKLRSLGLLKRGRPRF